MQLFIIQFSSFFYHVNKYTCIHYQYVGATACHILYPIIGLWEMGVHGCLCMMIIAFSSIALLIRVIIQKCRRNQIFQWKKYRSGLFHHLLGDASVTDCVTHVSITNRFSKRIFLTIDLTIHEKCDEHFHSLFKN